MRLLYIHQYFVFPDTPGATRSYDLATSFVNHGYSVVVITSSSFLEGEFSKRWTVLNREGLEVHVLRSRYSNQLSFLQRLMKFIGFMFYTMLRSMKIKADVVIATSTPLTVAVPALIKRIFQRTPFVFEVRDCWPEAPVALKLIKSRLLIRLLEKFERHVYRAAAHVVVLSPDMKASILRRTKVQENKLTVIPNISIISRFQQPRNAESLLQQQIGFIPKRSLLYAGTFGLVNGLDALLLLAKETGKIDPELKYILTGWGAQKGSLMHTAAEMGLLNSTVYFIPPIAKNNIPRLYHECSVSSSFVLPVKELWSNSANKFFDSLAAGKPIVINYEGWQAELIKQQNIGFVIDHNRERIGASAAAFCVYMRNEQLLQQQAQNALQLARENYSLDAATGAYLRVLQKISRAS